MKDQSKFLAISKALFFLVFAIALVPITLTLFSQYGQGGWYKNIQAELINQPYARTVQVSADGKVTAKPDIAKVTLSVTSNGKTVKEVTTDGNTRMTAVIDAMKKLGIKPEDMQTSQYDLSPQYDYNYPPYTSDPSKLPKIIGYILTQSVDLKIRDLTKVDDVLDQATQTGANQVGSLAFAIDDASQYKNDARKQAFDAAKAKAQSMADAAGVKLGRVVTFSEDFTPVVPMTYANFAVGAAKVESAPAPSVEAGSQELQVSVSVTYEIE